MRYSSARPDRIERFSMPKAKSLKPKAGNEVPNGKFVPSARVAALKMLARRELSEAQIRQRLVRRGYEADDIDSAIDRLKSDGSINDARVAGAIARTETSLKKRGRRRVAQQIQRAGIASAIGQRAVTETFQELDEKALIDLALAKRLHHGRTIADDREFARLYRYLVGQGFESDAVMATLSKRRSSR
jgi:regulatory protein